MKSSLSTPSLKKAPLATEDHLDDLEGAASEAKDSEVKDSEVKIVHLRPHQRSHNQRRCQSEVTPSKTAELLVSSKHGLRTPNEGINQRYLKIWADVADKICCRHT